MNKNEFLHGKTRWKGLLILSAAIFATPFVFFGVAAVIADARVPKFPHYDGKMPESAGEMCKRLNEKNAAMEADLKETIAKHPDFMTSAETRRKIIYAMAAKYEVYPRTVCWSKQIPEHLVEDILKERSSWRVPEKK